MSAQPNKVTREHVRARVHMLDMPHALAGRHVFVRFKLSDNSMSWIYLNLASRYALQFPKIANELQRTFDPQSGGCNIEVVFAHDPNIDRWTPEGLIIIARYKQIKNWKTEFASSYVSNGESFARTILDPLPHSSLI